MATYVDTRCSHAWCLFRSSAQPYAIRLDSVCEIVPLDRLVSLPLSPPGLIGLCAIRHEIIPVLGLADGQPGGDGRVDGINAVLVLHSEQGAWGVGTSREGIAVFEATAGQEVASGPDADGPEAESSDEVVGAVRKGETLYTVIDPDQAWSGARSSIQRWYGQIHAREALPDALPQTAPETTW